IASNIVTGGGFLGAGVIFKDGLSITALFRYGRTTSKSFTYVMMGALLFMTSDSLLAINKFLNPLPLSGISIMLTYCLAQYLIVEGIIAHKGN
ncbi:MAG: lysoplasmalogenase family protein, partial [Flammeovirgaceae bacterium]